MKAIWNGQVIADSDDTEVVEGNHYFPESSVNKQFLLESKTNTFCGWKGKAFYYTLNVNGKTNKDAAWYYPEPFDKAVMVKNRIAFWKGVEITR